MALQVERTAEGWRAFDADNPEVDTTRPDRAEAIHAVQAKLDEWNAAQKREAQAQARATAHVPMATGYVPLNPFGAAGYLAVLAYPGKPNERDKMLRAVEAWARHEGRKCGGLSLSDVKAMELEPMRQRDYERAILKCFRAITRERLPFVSELFWHGYRVATEDTEPLRPMFEAVAAHWVRQGYVASDSQPDNAARAWSETKPVLHLADAFYKKAVPLFTPETLSAEAILYRWHEWLEPALQRAEALRLEWMGDGPKAQAARLAVASTGASMADMQPQWNFTAADMVQLWPESGTR